MTTLRVAVTGGRKHQISREGAQRFLFRLVELLTEYDADTLVLLHGGARGVDQEAARLVEAAGKPTVEIPAPWEPLKKLLGEADSRWKAAGNIRNWQLLQGADVLVAFPGGRGTQDCIRQAGELGVRVVRIGVLESG